MLSLRELPYKARQEHLKFTEEIEIRRVESIIVMFKAIRELEERNKDLLRGDDRARGPELKR